MPDFAAIFSQLRHASGKSQRTVAQEMQISQALLSHYENGVREPRLDFVVRACAYYGVSADYMLGRTQEKNNPGLDCGSDGDGVQRLLRSDIANLPAVRRYMDGAALLLCMCANQCAPEETPPERLCTAVMHLWAAQALESAGSHFSSLDQPTQAALAQAAERAAQEISAVLHTEGENRP
jgi:transcriptional regulator with XRE-family HTH domain